MQMILTGAYGRDYPTAEAAVADWKAGKDFIIRTVVSRWVGKACSIRDAGQFDEPVVKIRFNRERDFVLFDCATGMMVGEEDGDGDVDQCEPDDQDGPSAPGECYQLENESRRLSDHTSAYGPEDEPRSM